jgi:acetyl esterase/lipase
MIKITTIFLGIVLPIASVSAQTAAPATREVPARTLSVPTTVSPQLQKIIGAPLPSGWNAIPKSSEELKAQVNAAAEAAASRLPAMRDQLQVKSEAVTIDGVKAYVLTPQLIPRNNRNRLLIHVHGGCYVSNPGESGTIEGIMMAGFGHFKVISVDYRMAPGARLSSGAR